MISGAEFWLWYNQAKKLALSANIPPEELNWLIQEVTNIDKLSLRLESFKEQSQITLKIPLDILNQKWQERINNKLPVQYIAEVTYWRNFSLKVTPSVLIPRPETEIIIDIIIDKTKNLSLGRDQQQNWADLGTGSGAIALGLAQILPNSTIHAIDISEKALNIAQENAQKTVFSEQIKFYHGSWWQPIAHLRGKITGMISNPPYIPSGIIPELQPEVRIHEPLIALDGGKDGLEEIRYLIETAPDYVIPGGIWLIEIMKGQADKVVQLLKDGDKYTQIEIIPDLEGIQRFVYAQLKHL